MMMECPRCHFAQPLDQYCAKCGLNIETYVVKPKPFWVRTLQNPNLHLSLIGILIAVVIGWIFYSQAGLVKREVGHLLDLPLSSRDAADPNEADNSHPNDEFVNPAAENVVADSMADPAVAMAGAEMGGTETGAEVVNSAGPTPPAAQRLEVSYWEIPRDLLAPVLAQGQRVGQGSGGRTYFWPQGAKLNEVLQSGAQSLAASRAVNLKSSEQMTVETPPTAPEMFQFGLQVQITKVEGKDVSIRWDANLVLPQPEPVGQTQPAIRQVSESSLTGNSAITAQSAVAIVFEPNNRAPREEYLAKAGDGPWNVFSSPEFRAGLTEWVIIVQLK